MTAKKTALATVCVSVLAMAMYVVRAQDTAPEAASQTEPQVVTLTGQVVDLHTFMTGNSEPSKENVKKSAACIREGVPAALKTKDGLVILGKGTKSPAPDIRALALSEAEVTGTIFSKDGIEYLDMREVKAASNDR